MTYVQSFGDYLRELRTQNNVSLRQLAKHLRVNFTYISKLENNKCTTPSEELIEKIANFFEVDSLELYLASGKIPKEITNKILNNKEIYTFLKNISAYDLKKLAEQFNNQRESGYIEGDY